MEHQKIKISIGVFAHNEEANILATLISLATQDIFTSLLCQKYITTISVLANGCTDKTATLARGYLNLGNGISGQVLEIVKSGKSNAWNEFIHAEYNAETHYYVCMDSDIAFGSKNVISSLLQALVDSDDAFLSLDIARKDTMLKPRKSFFEHMSLFLSGLMRQGSTALAGSLYCARGEKLREITMPEGLPVEDGFLRAMLVTELFTKKDNDRRILVVDDVCHYFTPESSIRSLFRHEERLLIGTFINSVIYGYLWSQVAISQQDAGILVRENNSQDPQWVSTLIENYRESHDPLIPRHFYFKYFNRLNSYRPLRRILLFPLACIASLVRYFLLKKVEKKLLVESGLGYW